VAVGPERREETEVPTGDVETYHRDERWRNRIEGSRHLAGAYVRKEDAVAAGRIVARERSVQHVIRNLDGTIDERTGYGPDHEPA
jgi:hypothetical protein